jgi:NAD(P)H-dependent FMN reductase
MGASPSGFGTLNAQTAWLPMIRYFKLRPCFANALYVSAAHEKFDADLKLKDEMTLTNLKKFLADFIAFAQQQM